MSAFYKIQERGIPIYPELIAELEDFVGQSGNAEKLEIKTRLDSVEKLVNAGKLTDAGIQLAKEADEAAVILADAYHRIDRTIRL